MATESFKKPQPFRCFLLLVFATTSLLLFNEQKSQAQDPIRSSLETSRFHEIFQHFLSVWGSQNPEEATRLGLHREEDRLTSWNDASYRTRLQTISETLSRLRELNKTYLRPEDRADEEIFKHWLLARKLEYDRWDIRAVKPQLYLPLGSIFDLFQKDYAPYPDRAQSALARLKQLPSVLGQGRKFLSHPPKIWTEQAIADGEQALIFFQQDLEPLFQPWYRWDPNRKPEVEAAIRQAQEAVQAHLSFLKNDVLPRSDGDFAAGKKVYESLLENKLHLDWSMRSLYRLGRKRFKETLGEIYKTAEKIEPKSHEDKKILWVRLVKKAQKDHLGSEQELSVYKKEVEKAYDEVQRSGLVSIPQDKIRIIQTPRFLRSLVPVSWYSPPYPLDDSAGGELYITPLDPALPAGQRQEMLENNFNTLEIWTIVSDEAVPGRHFQLCVAKHVRSSIRKISESPVLSEGWALYAQELAWKNNSPSEPARLVLLRRRLLQAALAMLDVQLHRHDVTPDKAVKFLEDEVHVPLPQAAALVLRCTLEPAQAAAGLVGLEEILQLKKKYRSAWGKQYSAKKFHNLLLSYGNLPLSLIREEMERINYGKEKF